MYAMRQLLCLLMLAVLFIVSACGGSTVQKATQPKRSKLATSTVAVTQLSHPINYPTRLAIPSIGISTFIESVGIQANGDLATPSENPWEDVGWYHLGTLPGNVGSAVFDGHLDRPGGSPAVFWRLRDVQVGNDVQVMNSANKIVHFRVTRIAYYAPNEAPLQDIFGNTSGTYLNLITCAGDWMPSQHQTTMRLVVYSRLV